MPTDPYCYPGTAVLKNNLGIKERDELERAEAAICMPLFIEALEDPGPTPSDFPQYTALHKRIFGALYPWAGEIRVVAIAKLGEGPYANPLYIESEGAKLFVSLADEKFLENLKFLEFVPRCAIYMGELHVLHPFREGNTRTLQLFVTALALAAGYELDWTLSNPNEIRRAGNSAVACDYNPYCIILREIECGHGANKATGNVT